MPCERIVIACGSAMTLCLASPAFAQTVTPPELERAGRLGEELLRQQQQIEAERQRERDRRAQTPSGGPQAAPAQAAPLPGPEGGCVTVRRLVIEGGERLPAADRRRAEQSVVGRCVDLAGINALLRQITEVFIARGLVTTRAYVPQQDTADGTLTIVIIEGVVERLKVEPEGSVNIGTAFPRLQGRIFDLRRAEQGIDQINRLASNSAKIDIRPGTTPGASEIVIVNQSRDRFAGYFAADNSGSPETGLWQATLGLAFDNPLGLNDGISGSIRRDLGARDEAGSSEAITLAYSVPYGWWTANVFLSRSKYSSLVQGITRDFVTNGTSDGATLRIDRVAYRDARTKFTIYGALNRLSTRNFIAGLKIGTSSRVLTTAQLNGNVSAIAGPVLASLDLGVTRGLDWLGALPDLPNQPDSAPRAQFTKLTFGAGINARLDLAGQPVALTSQLTGQWSDDVLFASEQLAIAGPFAARGYRDVRLFGDRGLYIRNEIATPFSFDLPALDTSLNIRPFAGIDFGRTFSHEGEEGRALSGWVTGFNLSVSRVSFQISGARAAWRSPGIPRDNQIFTRLSVAF